MSIELYKGDCLEVMKQLPSKSVDCFICDLPYGQLNGANVNKGLQRMENGVITGKRAETPNGTLQGCAWDVKLDLKEFWNQVERLAKSDDTPVIHFCNTRFGIDLINSKPDWFRYDLVWDKTRGVSFLLANKMPMKSHEMIYVFSKKGSYYNRVDVKTDKKEWIVKKDEKINKNLTSIQYGITRTTTDGGKDGLRCALSVIQLSKQARDGHPTEKPLELYKWLIERYCPANGTILDPTAGSFNCCFAGYELDSVCIGIEKDDKYYKKACEKADGLAS